MNINLPSQALQQLTYNSTALTIPRRNHLNIFMGIGLWSKDHGLSSGLPVDIMHMLLSAVALRAEIAQNNAGQQSRVVILIANSMAVHEGADIRQVGQITDVYVRSIVILLEQLNLKDCTNLVLSSDLEADVRYRQTIQTLEREPSLDSIRSDAAHYNYILRQTAINSYMETYRDVGVKIGWIYKDSSRLLTRSTIEPETAARWDELKFDCICKKVLPASIMQYLYTKAGMSQSAAHNGDERPPYTSYARDDRYTLQDVNIVNIPNPSRALVNQWAGIAELCTELANNRIISTTLLPSDCIHRTNRVQTVRRMLNHWLNLRAMYQTISRLLGDALPNLVLDYI